MTVEPFDNKGLLRHEKDDSTVGAVMTVKGYFGMIFNFDPKIVENQFQNQLNEAWR